MKWLYRQLSLPILMPRLRFLSPWLLLVSLILFIWTVWSVVHAPVDVQQGEVYRIIYAHVPMAALSMMIYTGLGLSSLLYLVFRFKLCDRVNQAIAPVGLVFSIGTLLTGMIWGRPTWGTWWIWDARLTSAFILMLLYVGYCGVRQQLSDPKQSALIGSVIAVVGLVNIPIMHYSVQWWFTLHQGSTVFSAKMHPDMLGPLMVSFAFWGCYTLAIVCQRLIVLDQVRQRRDDVYHQALGGS